MKSPKKDSIKFDCSKGRFYVANKRAIKKHIRRWKEKYPYVGFDDLNTLIEEANLSILLKCLKTSPLTGGLLTSQVDPKLVVKVYDQVRKNPQKSFEDHLSEKNLRLSSMLSEKQKDTLLPGNSPKKDNPKFTAQSRALAVLAQHPNWTDTKIAEVARIYRTSLYRMNTFVAARELQKKEGRKKMPRGSKDPETGKIEAW